MSRKKDIDSIGLNRYSSTSAARSRHTDAASGRPNPHTVLTLREPTKEDGAQIHALIKACPPLDLNSVYAYLVLCEHFYRTCVVATDEGGEVLGFVSAYVPPGRDDVLFVWQVAVHERARGQRLAQRMIDAVLQRSDLNKVRFIETTVGPENAASRATFQRLAAGGLPISSNLLCSRPPYSARANMMTSDYYALGL